jgi:hypothetical protein
LPEALPGPARASTAYAIAPVFGRTQSTADLPSQDGISIFTAGGPPDHDSLTPRPELEMGMCFAIVAAASDVCAMFESTCIVGCRLIFNGVMEKEPDYVAPLLNDVVRAGDHGNSGSRGRGTAPLPVAVVLRYVLRKRRDTPPSMSSLDPPMHAPPWWTKALRKPTGRLTDRALFTPKPRCPMSCYP